MWRMRDYSGRFGDRLVCEVLPIADLVSSSPFERFLFVLRKSFSEELHCYAKHPHYALAALVQDSGYQFAGGGGAKSRRKLAPGEEGVSANDPATFLREDCIGCHSRSSVLVTLSIAGVLPLMCPDFPIQNPFVHFVTARLQLGSLQRSLRLCWVTRFQPRLFALLEGGSDPKCALKLLISFP
jgi:hypothetical protein